MYDILLSSLENNHTGVLFSTIYNTYKPLFPKNEPINFENLLKIANLNSRIDAINFINKINKKYQKLPKWLISPPSSSSSLSPKEGEEEDDKKINFSLKEIPLLKSEFSSLFDIDIDDSNLDNIFKLSIDTNNSETYLSKYYGPVNSTSSSTSSKEEVEEKEEEEKCLGESPDGLCRMLSCTCNYNEDDEDIMLYNGWFTGYCQNCNLNIRDASHCVRFPNYEGGWSGCFCSLRCMKDNDNYTKDSFFDLRYENLKDLLLKYKIINRLNN